jgi:hypothetical protein
LKPYEGAGGRTGRAWLCLALLTSRPAVVGSRSAYSRQLSQQSFTGKKSIHTIKLDIVSAAAPVENLNTDFALGQASGVEPHNCQNSLQDLSSNHSWLRKPATQYQNITPEILRAECILYVADEVTTTTLAPVDN